MRYFSYTTTTDRSYVLIIALLVHLTNNSAYGNESTFPTNTTYSNSDSEFEPICDDEYRLKYINETYDEESYRKIILPLRESETEFLSIEDSPNDLDGSSEFLDHEQSDQNSIDSLNETSTLVFLNLSIDETKSNDVEYNNEKKTVHQIEDRELMKGYRQAKIKIAKNSHERFSQKSKKEPKIIGSNIHRKIINRHHYKSANTSNTHHPNNEWGQQCPPSRRIVGGRAVDNREKVPYMVFIDTGCGGAVISNIFVITAAHCFVRKSPRYVYVGSLNLLGGCQYNVDKFYSHPRFSIENLRFDIGLLTVTPNFTFTPAIQPIKLSIGYSRVGVCGTLTGWGATQYQGPPARQLLMTLIPIVPRNKCRHFHIKRGQFCAGFKDAHSDTCQGDSGGPFVVDGRVAGIISYGYQCAARETPAVYTDVFHCRKWIHSTVGNLSSES